MSGAHPRLAAGQLLNLVLDRRRSLDEAMREVTAFTELTGSDRAFARAITSAALRHAGWIDQCVSRFLSRPLGATGPEIRALVRAGAAQLWFLDTPAHAAVSETVEAARLWPAARSGGSFLNAVLRRISENPQEWQKMSPLALWPDWLSRRLVETFGEARALDMARVQMEEPRLHICARNDAHAVADANQGIVMACGTVEIEARAVETLQGFETGEWWVQDAAARLPARLLAPASGERILDLCAAPGGKTLQLAAAGARVTALDRSRPRLDRLEENLRRTRLSADIILADAATWTPERKFPKILLDAPCSALGTLRRHPEGAWIKNEADISRFPQIQLRLLKAAADMLEPGGAMVYAVCTPLAAEGREVIETFLQNSPLHRIAIRPGEIPGFENSLTPEGDLLTLPLHGRSHDSFFICRLGRDA